MVAQTIVTLRRSANPLPYAKVLDLATSLRSHRRILTGVSVTNEQVEHHIGVRDLQHVATVVVGCGLDHHRCVPALGENGTPPPAPVHR